jgi:hypothetical protein
MDEREDGGIGADAEGERANGCSGKERGFSEQTEGVSQVGKEVHGVLDGGTSLPVYRKQRASP